MPINQAIAEMTQTLNKYQELVKAYQLLQEHTLRLNSQLDSLKTVFRDLDEVEIN